jgi:hypothetical protein
LQATIRHLTRSALHQCLKRHAISHLPEIEGGKPQKKTFKPYPIEYFHIDMAKVRTEEGKLYLFVALDRTSKFASAELHTEAMKTVAAQFLRNLMATVPDKLHLVLTDHGIQLTKWTQDKFAFKHL